MNRLKTLKNRVGLLKKPDGLLTQSDEESANVLCDYFQSVLIDDQHNRKSRADTTESRSEMEQDQEQCGIKFGYQLVKDKLLKLRRDKSPGPDGIHPMLLSNCAAAVAIPLSLLFPKSMDEGR